MLTRFAGAALLTAVMLALALATPAPTQTTPRVGEANSTLLLANSRQMLVVITPHWDAMKGTLRRYERPNPTSPWQAVDHAFTVVVGKNGLAWADGLQQHAPADRVKHEGDGKAPAGIFRLGNAFGHSAGSMPGLRIPYLPLTASDGIECVDDLASRHYNRLVSQHDVEPDWKSSEKMWTEPLYKWGVVVAYNTPNPKPGAGSCIFLHIWKAADAGTAGCTAMPEADLTALMRWLDPARNPVLVQLPLGEYRRLKPEWRLP